MSITLEPINDNNRDAVLALSVREDQPFVAPNDVSLRQADEANAEQPGVARPFAIYADEKLVGFCMFAFNPEDEDEDDRYWLWRFMIDKNEQGKGYGHASGEAVTIPPEVLSMLLEEMPSDQDLVDVAIGLIEDADSDLSAKEAAFREDPHNVGAGELFLAALLGSLDSAQRVGWS